MVNGHLAEAEVEPPAASPDDLRRAYEERKLWWPKVCRAIADQLAIFWFSRMMCEIIEAAEKVDLDNTWSTLGVLIESEKKRNQFHRPAKMANEVARRGRYLTPSMPGMNIPVRAKRAFKEMCRQNDRPAIEPELTYLEPRAENLVALRTALVFVHEEYLEGKAEPLSLVDAAWLANLIEVRNVEEADRRAAADMDAMGVNNSPARRPADELIETWMPAYEQVQEWLTMKVNKESRQ